MVKNSQQISPRGFLKMFQCLYDFLSRKQKCSATEKVDGNCHVFSNSCRAILSCLLLADRPIFKIFHPTQSIGTFSQQVPVLFGHFPAVFQQSFRIAQRLIDYTITLSSGCPIAFKCISKQHLAKCGNLHLHALKHCVSIYIYQKSKKQWKILKNGQQLSLITDLSNSITHSQSQSRAIPCKEEAIDCIS